MSGDDDVEPDHVMLVVFIIGWVIVVPATVVGGLLLASSVLGRRARRAGALEATGLARELGRLAEATPQLGREDPSATVAERRPVGAAS